MNIAAVQTIRKIVLFAAIALGVLVFAVTNSRHASDGTIHEMIEWIGIVLIVACILGRTWASLYIGGRKIDALVMDGPYSTMRNPLYFFSFLGAVGAGAQTGSVVIALICGLIAFAVFYIVVLQEEKLLLERYGAPYRDYMARVPRFLPNPALWKDEPMLTIRPPRVLMTFADALVFLLAVPAAEGFEYLQETGVFPVLFLLP
ncbi:MAG: isoprenylcysteine carboxylmethyltransferase family protein [Pseudorhodoplanes sp.]|jgi:protein-S-isoprenylcysteine O-methyltransferase Ste14|nr:isoprenylcysteine carboxylmethyltransferase family protein [Pseudorhodoplanes sp.]